MEEVKEMLTEECATARLCQNCKQELGEGQKFCPNCGTEYKEPVVPEAPTPRLCQNCQQELSEGQKFCANCGTEYKEPVVPEAPKPRLCQNCQQELGEGKKFCANCGTEYKEPVTPPQPELIDAVSTAKKMAYYKAFLAKKAKNNKKPLIISCVAILLGLILLAVVLVNALRVPVTTLNVDKEEVTLMKGESITLSCSVLPYDATDKTITYTSSDTSVAEVTQYGQITAIEKGTCTITVKAGKISKTVSVTVTNHPDLKAIYSKCCTSTIWSTLGSDNSYIQIDSNPYDYDDGDSRYTSTVLTAIQNINDALGLPESLYNDMLQTTWSMGKQTATYAEKGIEVTWTYHPDKGIEISYKIIVN